MAIITATGRKSSTPKRYSPTGKNRTEIKADREANLDKKAQASQITAQIMPPGKEMPKTMPK